MRNLLHLPHGHCSNNIRCFVRYKALVRLPFIYLCEPPSLAHIRYSTKVSAVTCNRVHVCMRLTLTSGCRTLAVTPEQDRTRH